MSTQPTQTTIADRVPGTAPESSVEATAAQLYDSECALHAARVAGVDEWITAAANRLHSALVAYLDANKGEAAFTGPSAS